MPIADLPLPLIYGQGISVSLKLSWPVKFGMKRIGWKETENKDVESPNHGAEDGQKVGDSSRRTAIS